ncbi:hypothetical protein [Dielma fastidiosa]|uniref:hypothetical protein n=1 Tax=Dielma fastidiosa TaxID=1034346 RepID=UPI0023F2DEBF|nr:hypothetical protein [Dielma fastidiosa]
MSIQFLIGLFTHEDVNANIEPPIVEQQSKPTVVIDPGHGGYDNGAVSYNWSGRGPDRHWRDAAADHSH